MAQNIAENGGFAYLIPYFAGEIFLSVPFAYLETIMGQYFQETLVGVWGICPILKGNVRNAVCVIRFHKPLHFIFYEQSILLFFR